jgi:hypothetical protein
VFGSGRVVGEYGVSVCYRYLLNYPNCQSLRAVASIYFVPIGTGPRSTSRLLSIVLNNVMPNMKAQPCSFSFFLFLMN